MNPIRKSAKLAHVLYDVRGPIVDAARQMEDEGQKIIRLKEVEIGRASCRERV